LSNKIKSVEINGNVKKAHTRDNSTYYLLLPVKVTLDDGTKFLGSMNPYINGIEHPLTMDDLYDKLQPKKKYYVSYETTCVVEAIDKDEAHNKAVNLEELPKNVSELHLDKIRVVPKE